jgi:hypothetical protein
MPEHRHEGFGGFGGGGWGGGGWGRGGWGGGWGGRPFIERRVGFPMFGSGFGFGGFGQGLGGFGSGLGGGGLLGDLLSGGIGYLAGKHTAQNQQQQMGQYQQYPPQYQQQYQPPAQPYQQQYQPQYQQPTPSYQAPDSQVQQANTQNASLAQLRLLGQLRQSGVLTDDEFQREKQKILGGS